MHKTERQFKYRIDQLSQVMRDRYPNLYESVGESGVRRILLNLCIYMEKKAKHVPRSRAKRSEKSKMLAIA